MKTITIKLYTYDELKPKAQERALADFVEHHDDPLMQSHMINLLKEELDERGIKYDEDSIDVRYSLSYSQGDGFMFEGDLEWNGRKAHIQHSGHYYHSHSKSVDMPDASEREYADFEQVYQAICKKLEKAGYAEIEYQQSEEYFKDQCEAAEWTFEESGRMRNV